MNPKERRISSKDKSESHVTDQCKPSLDSLYFDPVVDDDALYGKLFLMYSPFCRSYLYYDYLYSGLYDLTL